jgi:radical SAM superfamily enzyme YgiQ (UPF0313 family)
MKILIIDPYPKVTYRISKDQNGGFGTANNYGDDFFSRIISKLVKNSIDFPPFYIVQVIGELVKQFHEVEFVKDLNEKKYNFDNYSFFIITTSIVCHETELEVIKVLNKETSFKKAIFAVGPFATTMPDKYIHSGAKVVKGEPEMFFYNLKINEDSIMNLPNLIDNIKLIELDSLSIPGWEVIFKNYVPKMNFLGKGPAVNINASRGCPYSCFYYCVYPLQQGRKLRLKSPDRLIEEMKYLKNKLNIINFIFRDPVFSIDKKHTLEICKRIIDEKLIFNICIETHLKNIDHELAVFFKKAGIKLIYVGIESSNEIVRKDSKRTSESNDEQINKVRLLEKLGIKVKAMYIIGLPTDTEESFLNTLDYAKKVNSTFAQFSVFTPYPGTPAFLEYKNIIKAKKFEDFTQWNLVFEHKNFTEEKIRKLLSYSYRSYYLNVRWILNYFIFKPFLNNYENFYYWLQRFFGKRVN